MKEVFFARALSESIYTKGEDIAELKRNIKDAVDCHFENYANKPKLISMSKDKLLQKLFY
jgi:predicted RNase H-like HicB family nuclease